jgi:16S rRNA (adenine1518-N6/adenine1519-N6)-dimethyltransferase
VRRVTDLPPSAFTPPPKVWSTVVRIEPRAEPSHPADRRSLERITEAAFGQRRKMLRQSLKGLGGDTLLATAGIEPTTRPERLAIAEFCRLANALTDRERVR